MAMSASADPSLTAYIKEAYKTGVPFEQIKQNLLSKGWNAEMVDKAIDEVRLSVLQNVSPNPSLNNTPTPSSTTTIPPTINTGVTMHNSQEESTSSPSDEKPPILSMSHIENPNRFFAIPILGGTIRIILLIPLVIVYMFYGMFVGFLSLLNSFAVLFTGKMMDMYYTHALNYLKMGTKISIYTYGLSNTYPSFNFELYEGMNLEIPEIENPSRLYAIPFVGFLIRYVLLIPFIVFTLFISIATSLGSVIASFVVLFTGKLPESLYEIELDYLRLYTRMSSFIFGLTNPYPSFKISWNHKGVKVTLIVISIILFLLYGIFYVTVYANYLKTVSQCEKDPTLPECTYILSSQGNNPYTKSLLQTPTPVANLSQSQQVAMYATAIQPFSQKLIDAGNELTNASNDISNSNWTAASDDCQRALTDYQDAKKTLDSITPPTVLIPDQQKLDQAANDYIEGTTLVSDGIKNTDENTVEDGATKISNANSIVQAVTTDMQQYENQ